MSRGTRRTTRRRPASAGAARVATTTVRSKPRQTRPSSAGPVSHRRRPASAGVTRTATTVRRPASAGVTRAVTTTVRSKPQPARPSSVEFVVRNIGSGNTAWQTQPNSPQPISIRDRRGVGLGLGSDGLRRGSKQRGPSALWHPHLEIEGPIRHPQNVKPPPDNNDLQNVNGHYDTANESSVRHKPMKFVTSSRSRFNGFAVIDAAAQNVELERDDQQRDRVFDVTKPLSPELPHPNSNRTNPIYHKSSEVFRSPHDQEVGRRSRLTSRPTSAPQTRRSPPPAVSPEVSPEQNIEHQPARPMNTTRRRQRPTSNYLLVSRALVQRPPQNCYAVTLSAHSKHKTSCRKESSQTYNGR